MKQRALTLVMTATALVTGCVPTLNPLYTEQDLIFDAALVGLWRDVDSDGETWSFEQAGEDSYYLVYTDDDGKRGEFQAHLVRIEGTMFLDLYPEEPELAVSDFYRLHLVPAHSFMLVESIEPELRMRLMDLRWLEEHLEQHPDAIAHAEVADRIVITASTEALQRFVIEHVETEGAFSDASTMSREI